MDNESMAPMIAQEVNDGNDAACLLHGAPVPFEYRNFDHPCNEGRSIPLVGIVCPTCETMNDDETLDAAARILTAA